MDATPFAYVALAAALWAGLFTLAVVARGGSGDPPRLATLFKLWGWLLLAVAVAGAGSALAGVKGLAAAMMLLVFACLALFARPWTGQTARR